MIIGSFISANIVDNKSAVTIYFAISISHLPNSFSIFAAKLNNKCYTTKFFKGKMQPLHMGTVLGC